jgi:hypothetical protein
MKPRALPWAMLYQPFRLKSNKLTELVPIQVNSWVNKL